MAAEITSLQIVVGCLSGVVTSGGIGAFLIFILKGLERRLDLMDERIVGEKDTRVESIGEALNHLDERMQDSDFNFEKKLIDLGGMMDRKKTDKDICKLVNRNIEKIYQEQQKMTQEIYKNQIEQGKELARMAANLLALGQQLENLNKE